MSLPITAVGPLKVETKPILMVSPATAGFASARAVAPASQNAVLIMVSLPRYFVSPVDRPAPFGERSAPVSGFSLSDAVFCARNGRPAASTNRWLPLRTFGSWPVFVHHNSYYPGMARIIVLVGSRPRRLISC